MRLLFRRYRVGLVHTRRHHGHDSNQNNEKNKKVPTPLISQANLLRIIILRETARTTTNRIKSKTKTPIRTMPICYANPPWRRTRREYYSRWLRRRRIAAKLWTACFAKSEEEDQEGGRRDVSERASPPAPLPDDPRTQPYARAAVALRLGRVVAWWGIGKAQLRSARRESYEKAPRCLSPGSCSWSMISRRLPVSNGQTSCYLLWSSPARCLAAAC